MFIASDLLVISVWEFPKQIHRQTEYGPKKELPAVLSFVILGKTFSFLGESAYCTNPILCKTPFCTKPNFCLLRNKQKIQFNWYYSTKL